ncbi:hypothetical protein LPJ66_003770 [Kickxella alabastrina]|uniref:Uncharacterized protein n=1 Tax=Kickxella alabastrina TaxID=61397 RepID=A0ACC1IJT3_9FUNG|nr:hypothetical protein LPJ66_003770 [Kickxella alabastrina]
MLAQVNNAAGSQSTTRSNSFNIDLEKKSIETQSFDKDTPDYLSKPSTITDIEEYAPAGCAYAWIIVACASLNMMCTIGIANSFGVFSTYYINSLYPNESAANIAWVATSITFFMLVEAIATGPLTDRFGFRLVSLAGAIICRLAILLTSFTNVLWQVVLTQGIMFGIGAACIFSPSSSLPSQWHDKTRPLATAITVAGSGAGSMLFTAITQNLLDAIGYKWALRVLALILLCISGTASLFYKRRESVPKGGVNFMAIARDKRLIVIGLAGFFVNVGLFMLWYYLPTAALALGQTKQASNNLILNINAGSTMSRVISGFIVMEFGPINIAIFSYLICFTLILVVMLAVKP